MVFAEDQHAVQDLAAQGADKALADRVHPRSLDSGEHDPGAGRPEDGVEGGGEVRSSVADEELDVLRPVAEGHCEVAGLLCGPFPGGVRGDAAQVHAAGAVLDEYQDVEALEQDGVYVQEADREDAGGLGCQELAPCWPGPARR
jgi:hypothetical protein